MHVTLTGIRWWFRSLDGPVTFEPTVNRSFLGDSVIDPNYSGGILKEPVGEPEIGSQSLRTCCHVWCSTL